MICGEGLSIEVMALKSSGHHVGFGVGVNCIEESWGRDNLRAYIRAVSRRAG